MTREPTVKTSLMLPTSVWKAARHFAVEHRMRLRDVVMRALEAYLARPRRNPRT